MPEQNEIQDRIFGRQFFDECLSDCEGSIREGFIRGMMTWMRKQAPDKLDAMSDADAREFGKTECPYRKHKGERMGDVPLDYLQFIADQGRHLQRYLNSRRIRDET